MNKRKRYRVVNNTFSMGVDIRVNIEPVRFVKIVLARRRLGIKL